MLRKNRSVVPKTTEGKGKRKSEEGEEFPRCGGAIVRKRSTKRNASAKEWTQVGLFNQQTTQSHRKEVQQRRAREPNWKKKLR